MGKRKIPALMHIAGTLIPREILDHIDAPPCCASLAGLQLNPERDLKGSG